MSDEGVETIDCTRKDCECVIDLIKENLLVARPEVPLLGAKCPECSKTRLLTKDLSIELIDKYFEGGLESLVDPEDLDDGPILPSKDLGQVVEETLALLGYKGKTWKDKVKAIVEFVRSSSTYQNPQGLHQLLAAWKVDSRHIPMIVEKVFGDVSCGGNTPQYNIPQNVNYSPPNYPGMQSNQTTPLGAGYSMTQTPQGQVVVLPPVTPAAPPVVKSDDDTVVIEEKVGKGGVVTSRIIKQKAPQLAEPVAAQKSGIEELGAMVAMMKDMGVIGREPAPPPPAPEVSPEITRTLDKMSAVLSTISASQSSNHVDASDRESAESKQYKSELKDLNEEIKQMREDGRKAEMDALRTEMRAMQHNANNTPNTGLNDFQFGIDSKQKNLQFVTSAVTDAGNKIIEPLVEMQKMQAQLNGMFAIRQLELQDNVPSGTYMQSVVPKADVPDKEVSDTLQKWRNRAGEDETGEVEDDKF